MLHALLPHRRRPEPPLDVGLPSERTAMAWQRTALAVAALGALLVHSADRRLVLAVPGILGLAHAFALLVVGERRYGAAVARVESGESPLARRAVAGLAAGVVAAAGSAAVVLVLAGA